VGDKGQPCFTATLLLKLFGIPYFVLILAFTSSYNLCTTALHSFGTPISVREDVAKLIRERKIRKIMKEYVCSSQVVNINDAHKQIVQINNFQIYATRLIMIRYNA
jgi:hypothetical protein